MTTLLGLATASWETICHRSVLIASGTCSPDEYWRMVSEKLTANHQATVAMLTGQGAGAVIAPYIEAAKANAERLRAER